VYEFRDAALMRLPAFPGELPGSWPDLLSRAPGAARQRREWIARALALPEVADAIEAASPDLAARLGGIVAGAPVTARQEQRAAVSLARYLLRLQHRPTPFGLLAGVATARITAHLDLRDNTGARAVASADDGWLAAVISGLETVPELLARLTVRADPTWTARGGRVLIPCQQRAGPDADGAPQEVSIRDTRAVRLVLVRARTPVSVAELTSELAAGSPDAPAGAAFRLVTGLVACRVLVTCLRAPMTVTDALAHLNDQLVAVSASTIPASAHAVQALREIGDVLARHATVNVAARRQLRAAACQRMRELSPASTTPVTTDLHLGFTADLPRSVGREAGKAAEILTRLTAAPEGTRPWRDYHARFLDRYGSGTVVRVMDLTDPYTGLGLPAGYRGAPPDASMRELTSRDEIVLALAQQAALDRAIEISLSRDQIAGLALPGDLTAPAHLDLCFQLHARSPQAVRDGDFTVAVVSLTPIGGAMTGRFLHLLDPGDRDRITAEYAALLTLDPAAVHVQISSPPLLARTGNVSRAPAPWPAVLSLAEHPAGPVISLDDLAVTADDRHMYLISLHDGRRLEPVTLNAVEAVHFTHPLARFLCELPRARVAVPGPFPWGPARSLPYLPRIRHGRAILAPATWRISPAVFPAPDRPWPEWARALQGQREHLAIPAAVYAGDGDERLRLDLDLDAHLQLLRAGQRPGRPLVLREAPGPAELGWLDGRAHEITLTLAATRTAPRHRPSRSQWAVADRGSFPGAGQYAVASLYGHARLIAARLPDLLAAWDQNQPVWWFTRPGPPEQVRLWLAAGEPGRFADAARKVATWAQQLHRQGLVGRVQWDTDYPCASRTGPAAVAAAAEHAFAADSRAVVVQLAWSTAGGPGEQALTVASILDLVISFTGSTAGGLQWVTAALRPGSHAPHPARTLRDEAVRLACPSGDFAALSREPGSDAVTTAWTARRAAVARYAATLRGDPSHCPDTALLALLRGHHQRMTGPDNGSEQLTIRLARSAAIAAIAQARASA